MCSNPLEALEQLIELRVDRILTSGAKNRAIDGIELLSELVRRSKDRIIIMPGSGVNENNLIEIAKETNAVEFHSSAKTFEKSGMQYFNSEIFMGDVKEVNEYLQITVDHEKIKKMVEILKSDKW